MLLLLATVLNLGIADPIPFVDEAVLVGLTGLCFGRHSFGKKSADESVPNTSKSGQHQIDDLDQHKEGQST